MRDIGPIEIKEEENMRGLSINFTSGLGGRGFFLFVVSCRVHKSSQRLAFRWLVISGYVLDGVIAQAISKIRQKAPRE